MVFPVVVYGCESWTTKKVEHRRIDAFELWCWRRLLRVPWTARRSNQSILKEINPEYSLEELMLKLKLQYFGHLMQRADSLEKTWGINSSPLKIIFLKRLLSVQFSHSVMSDSSQPHGLQHARLPCPSPTSGACLNSGPLSG